MADIETARQIILSLPETEEYDHFGRPAFKIKGKRTFASLWPAEQRMMVQLSLVDQSVFNSFDPAVFYPVPNKWGLKGGHFHRTFKSTPGYAAGCRPHGLAKRIAKTSKS